MLLPPKMGPKESLFLKTTRPIGLGAGLGATSLATRPKMWNTLSMSKSSRPISFGTSTILGGISGGTAAAAPFVAASSFIKAPGLIKSLATCAGVGAVAGAVIGGAVAGPINTFLTPFNIKRAERGTAPISAAPIAAVSTGIGVGLGSMIGALGKNLALAGVGAVVATSMLSTGIGNMAKSMHAAVQSEQGNSPYPRNGKIKGSYNDTRKDNMHTAYLPQSLHKVRHKRVL